MADLTFAQQLWLAAFDKLALASALVGVGFVANRQLEAFKLREGLRSQLLKDNLTKVATHLEQVSERRHEVWLFCSELWREAGGSDSDLINRRLHVDTAAKMAAAFDADPRRVSLRDAVVAEQRAIQRDAFWLPRGVASELFTECDELLGALVNSEFARQWLESWYTGGPMSNWEHLKAGLGFGRPSRRQPISIVDVTSLIDRAVRKRSNSRVV